jgi:excisionase family DNA binding protein
MPTPNTKSEIAAGDSKPATNGNGKLAYTVPEAAAMLGCGHGSIRKFLRQRRLTKVPDFRKILIPRSSLEKFASP